MINPLARSMPDATNLPLTPLGVLAKAVQWGLAILLILPILAIALTAVIDGAGGESADLLRHLIATRLFEYFANTLILMTGVGALVLIFGISAAWIISRYDFPFRGVLAVLLVLPLAAPAYLVAYAYTDFLEYAGLVQTALRTLMGWENAGEYWFPEIRSMGGAVVVMASVLYPYVYITAVAAFRMTSTPLFESAILAGKKQLLFVALPLVRPAIVAGLALALMEVVSDFGTVEYFAVDTITLGIFNVWLGMNSIMTAAQLAVMAVGLVVVLLLMESQGRKQRRFENAARGDAGVPRVRVRGAMRLFLPLICLVPVLLGFIMPVAILLRFILSGVSGGLTPDSSNAIFNSLFVAILGAGLIVAVAAFLGIMAVYRSGRWGRIITAISAMGYAFPGTILAIGVLVVVGYVDGVHRLINPDARLIISGSLVMLMLGYVVRFQAVGYGVVQVGLEKLPPNVLAASRVMGHGFGVSVWRIIVPLLRPSMLAGVLLAFVDIMKELPLSLLLRPFNFETLATLTYQFAKEEMLEEAAIPALIIVAVGLVPVLVVHRALVAR